MATSAKKPAALRDNQFFLNGAYFVEQTEFRRFQDIKSRYFSKNPRTPIFLSHQWETPDHPDPHAYQFRVAKHLIDRLRKKSYVTVPETWSWLGSRDALDWDMVGIFYDYSCLPQNPRTAEEENIFQRHLREMHQLVSRCATLVIPSKDYLKRSWCNFESQVSFLMGTAVWILDYHGPVFDWLAFLILYRNMVIEYLWSPEMRVYFGAVDSWFEKHKLGVDDGIDLSLTLFPMVFDRLKFLSRNSIDRRRFHGLDEESVRNLMHMYKQYRAFDTGNRVSVAMWAKFAGLALWSDLTENFELSALFDKVFTLYERTSSSKREDYFEIRNQLLLRMMNMMFAGSFSEAGYVYLDSNKGRTDFPRHHMQYTPAERRQLCALIDRDIGIENNIFRQSNIPEFYRVYGAESEGALL